MLQTPNLPKWQHCIFKFRQENTVNEISNEFSIIEDIRK